MNKRAAVYGRVSLLTGKGSSVDDQLSDMTAACKRAGYEVTHTLRDDGIGASRYSRGTRADFAALVALIKSGTINAVGIWEPSRLTRDLGVAVNLRDDCEAAGVVVVTNTATYDFKNDGDRLAWVIMMALAEQQARTISKTVQRGVASRAKVGNPHGKNNYGLQRIYSATGRLEDVGIVEVEAAILREAAEHVLQGGSLSSMVTAFNKAGVASPDAAVAARVGRMQRGSGLWTIAGLRTVLASPASAGLRVHRGEVIGTATWPAIITPDQQAKLKATFDARKVGKRRGGITHWPSGLLECSVCHQPMRLTGRVGDARYWQCAKRCAAVRDEELTTHLRTFLVALITAVAAAGIGTTEDDSTAEGLSQAIAQAKDREAEAVASFSAGRIPLAVVESISAEIKTLSDALREALAIAEAPDVVVTVEEVRDEWDSISAERKREIARASLGTVVVLPAGRGRKVPVEDRLRYAKVKRAG